VTGWGDENGREIGDKFNFVYSTTAPITLSNGSQWQIQELWSDAAGGCVQGRSRQSRPETIRCTVPGEDQQSQCTNGEPTHPQWG
jgi:hypothetical protein